MAQKQNDNNYIDLCDSQSPEKTSTTSQPSTSTSRTSQPSDSHASTSRAGRDSPELEDWSAIISSDYIPEVCMMECGCCFGEEDVEKMVQCSDGHLFCSECLQRYAQEAIHGQGKSQLTCMTADCEAQFPRSQMRRALTEDLINKFDERVQEESLNLAALQNLVRCPECNYAAEIVDEEQKVFVCPQCEKRSCRHCHADWNDHEGLTCKQVENKDETSLRTKYEEKMTAARVRHCPKCKTPLLKEGGCNKVTCRCGGTICYICRKEKIEYEHFCQHPGPFDKVLGCRNCKKCSLWTDGEADDRRIIEELKAQGQLERTELGFSEERHIGAPPDAKDKAASSQGQPGRHMYNVRIPAPINYPLPGVQPRPLSPNPPFIPPGTDAKNVRRMNRKHSQAMRRYVRDIQDYERNLGNRVNQARHEPPAMQAMVHNAPPHQQPFYLPPVPALPIPAVAADLLTGRGGAVNLPDRVIRLPQQQPADIFMRAAVRARAPATHTAPHQPVAPHQTAHQPAPVAHPVQAENALTHYRGIAAQIIAHNPRQPQQNFPRTATARQEAGMPNVQKRFNQTAAPPVASAAHPAAPAARPVAPAVQTMAPAYLPVAPAPRRFAHAPPRAPANRHTVSTPPPPPQRTMSTHNLHNHTRDTVDPAIVPPGAGPPKRVSTAVNTKRKTPPSTAINRNDVAMTTPTRPAAAAAVSPVTTHITYSRPASSTPAAGNSASTSNCTTPKRAPQTQLFNNNQVIPADNKPANQTTIIWNYCRKNISGSSLSELSAVPLNINPPKPSTDGVGTKRTANGTVIAHKPTPDPQPSTSATQNHSVVRQSGVAERSILSDSDDDDLLFHEVMPGNNNRITTNNIQCAHSSQSASSSSNSAAIAPNTPSLPGVIAGGNDEDINRLQSELNEMETRMTRDLEREHEARIDAMYTAMEQERAELSRFIAGKQEDINRKRKLRIAAGDPPAKKPTSERFEL